MKLKTIYTIALMLFALSANAKSSAPQDLPDSTYYIKKLLNCTTSPRRFDNHYTVTPPEGYVLLDEENTKKFLVNILGNPIENTKGVLGCIVPDARLDSIPFFFVITDEMCGYISDKDATHIDYDELLKDIQEMTKEENDKYRKEHPEYPKVRLIGWYETPYYDKTAHTLYWGKKIDFQQEYNTINYDMCVLGKEGYVSLNAVGDETAVAELKEAGQQMLHNVSFDKGYTYDDFDENTDHVAQWTIGGLIAGKVLTKAGFWAVVAKFWKVILVAIIGGLGAARAFFSNFFKSITDRIFRRKNE